MNKTIIVISGPNGSGKTTFAETFFKNNNLQIPFLNPDLIAAGIDLNDHEAASFQAGRVLLTEIKNKIEEHESFSFESTLSGLTYASLLKKAKAAGYKIIIYFVYLNKVSLNSKRIKQRVSQGGHNITQETLKRRHLRCFHNFFEIYRPLCDEWYILNNSTKSPKLNSNHLIYEKLTDEKQIFYRENFLKGQP